MTTDFEKFAAAAVPHAERFAALCERHVDRGTPMAFEREVTEFTGTLLAQVPRETLEKVVAAFVNELRDPAMRTALVADVGRHLTEMEQRVAHTGGAPARLLELLHAVDVAAPGLGIALCAREFDPQEFGIRAMRPLRSLVQLQQADEPEHAIAALLEVAKSTIETSYATLARVMMRVDEARQGFDWSSPRTNGAVIHQAAERFAEINAAAAFYRNAQAHEGWKIALDTSRVQLANHGRVRDLDVEDLYRQVMRIFADGLGLFTVFSTYSLGVWWRSGAFERALIALAAVDPDSPRCDLDTLLDFSAAASKLRALRPRPRRSGRRRASSRPPEAGPRSTSGPRASDARQHPDPVTVPVAVLGQPDRTCDSAPRQASQCDFRLVSALHVGERRQTPVVDHEHTSRNPCGQARDARS